MDKTQTKCEWCGKVFTPTDDNLVESGFSVHDPDEEEHESWKEPEVPEMNDAQALAAKAAFKLTDNELKELRETGEVMSGMIYVCDECLDEGMEDDS